MKKWMIRVLSVLLIAAFLPVSVLADEYDLSEGRRQHPAGCKPQG